MQNAPSRQFQNITFCVNCIITLKVPSFARTSITAEDCDLAGVYPVWMQQLRTVWIARLRGELVGVKSFRAGSTTFVFQALAASGSARNRNPAMILVWQSTRKEKVKTRTLENQRVRHPIPLGLWVCATRLGHPAVCATRPRGWDRDFEIAFS